MDRIIPRILALMLAVTLCCPAIAEELPVETEPEVVYVEAATEVAATQVDPVMGESGEMDLSDLGDEEPVVLSEAVEEAPAVIEAAPEDMPEAALEAPEFVEEDPEAFEDEEPEIEVKPGTVPPMLTNAEMVANLSAYSGLGRKRDAVASVAKLLLDRGYEPAFVAGVCANVFSEGSYGLFESSGYTNNRLNRPRYFCYLDGGEYYTYQNGEYVLKAVYLSEAEYDEYDGPGEKRLQYGETDYYHENWSGKYIWEVDLDELRGFMDLLTNACFADGTPDDIDDGKGWHGKFGLGITQWTGGRTRKLLSLYRKHAGKDKSTITPAQAIAAENEMLLYDLQGDYRHVYTGWRNENADALYCAEAARSAGSWVCLRYEVPSNKERSAVTRGKRAAKYYRIMTGE